MSSRTGTYSWIEAVLLILVSLQLGLGHITLALSPMMDAPGMSPGCLDSSCPASAGCALSPTCSLLPDQPSTTLRPLPENRSLHFVLSPHTKPPTFFF